MKGLLHRTQTPALPSSGSEAVPPSQWVVFTLDAGRYALPLAAVERIVRAAQITILPNAPDVVLGAINIQGQVLPVFSLRRRFGLTDRPITPDDEFLITRAAQRRVVLVIDAAQGVMEHPAMEVVDAHHVSGNLEHISGVIPLDDGMLLIHDLSKLLSPEEVRALDAAIQQGESHAR